jgi:hypothetical protein
MALILLFIFLLAGFAFASIIISAPSEDLLVTDDFSLNNDNSLLEEGEEMQIT